MKKDILFWEEDGLPIVVKRSRAEDKYRTLFNYMELFSTGMKNKYKRVYIDLYAGSGCARIEGDEKIFKGSALLSLSVKQPFDKYIFCEENRECVTALRKRIQDNFSPLNTIIIEGDCNNSIDSIIDNIPKSSISQNVLTLCIVDPDSLDVHYDSLKKLANVTRIDFIVLLALMMDANRNESNYIRPDNVKVESFLGKKDWRPRWMEYKERDNSFPRYLTSEFENQMMSIGYRFFPEVTPKKEIRSKEKNLPLYHLAFFSKSEKGIEFWKKGLKYSSDQTTFEFV